MCSSVATRGHDLTSLLLCLKKRTKIVTFSQNCYQKNHLTWTVILLLHSNMWYRTAPGKSVVISEFESQQGLQCTKLVKFNYFTSFETGLYMDGFLSNHLFFVFRSNDKPNQFSRIYCTYSWSNRWTCIILIVSVVHVDRYSFLFNVPCIMVINYHV